MDFTEAMRRIRAINASKGWESEVTKDKPWMFTEKMMLVVTEIAEAVEHYRNGWDVNEIFYGAGMPQKPDGVPIELADAIIRILDFCEANKIDIEAAIQAKMLYNESRPYKHGGKRI